MIFDKSAAGVSFVFLNLLALSACGSANSILGGTVTSMSARSYTQNGAAWVSLSAELNTGSMILAGVTVPVIDPANPSVIYGELSLTSGICSTLGVCSGGTLDLAVNLTAVAQVKTTSDLLPNGTLIPVSATQSLGVVALPVGSGGRIYINLSPGVALLGVALPFEALNTVGTYIPGIDIFDAFTVSSINGAVGLFTGPTPSTTGIALFVDLSGVINTAPVSAVKAMVATAVTPAVQTNRVTFLNVTPSTNAQQALEYKIYQLNKQHAKLRFN